MADDTLSWAGFGGVDRVLNAFPGGGTPKLVIKAEATIVQHASAVGGSVAGMLSMVWNSVGKGYREIVARVPGRIISEANALKPGPLGDDLKFLPGTFSGARYATMELEESLIVYRAWTAGQSREYGAFWSLDKPLGSLSTRIDSALLPEWGRIAGTNFRAQATHYTAIEIPKGTVIHVGEVGSQGGVWVGSGSQLIIEGGVHEGWKIGQGVLK